LERYGTFPPYENAFPQFSKISVGNTTFPKDYFDLVVVNYVFHWLNDQREAVRELARITKPGGKICGTQAALEVGPAQWVNFIIGTVLGVSGTLPGKEFRQYFKDAGLKFNTATMAGFFCAEKPKIK